MSSSSLVTIDKMTAQDTLIAYSKRDCVEKKFQALKSHLDMDKIGVTTEEAMYGKGLVWFVASILHACMFCWYGSSFYHRQKNTVQAMIEELEAIKADKDLKTSMQTRRYRLTRCQQNDLKRWKTDEKDIEEKIANLSE